MARSMLGLMLDIALAQMHLNSEMRFNQRPCYMAFNKTCAMPCTGYVGVQYQGVNIGDKRIQFATAVKPMLRELYNPETRCYSFPAMFRELLRSSHAQMLENDIDEGEYDGIRDFQDWAQHEVDDLKFEMYPVQRRRTDCKPVSF